MGQKVNPIGFRVGINKNWDSRWYAKKDYAILIHEDFKLRKYLKQKLNHAGVSKIEIERAASKIKINILALATKASKGVTVASCATTYSCMTKLIIALAFFVVF